MITGHQQESCHVGDGVIEQKRSYNYERKCSTMRRGNLKKGSKVLCMKLSVTVLEITVPETILFYKRASLIEAVEV